jgi:uncharacterized protein (DUF3820 family)
MENDRIIWKKRLGYLYYQVKSLFVGQKELARDYDTLAVAVHHSNMVCEQSALARPDYYDRSCVEELADYTTGAVRFADFAGRVAYDAEGKEIFNFGKYKGMRVADVFRRDPGYHGWIQQGDFPQYTKAVFMRVYLSLRG